MADGILIQLWVILLEIIRECESHNRKTSVVVCAGRPFVIRFLALLKLVDTLLAVDVADLGNVNNGTS
jgi:hypothetical protein